jgi:hypothetical protein
MLFYCEFTWHPHTTSALVRERHARQLQAKALHPETWRGWYSFAGMGAGFLLIEADDPASLGEILTPYSDLMRFDVRALRVIDKDEVLTRIAQEVGLAA